MSWWISLFCCACLMRFAWPDWLRLDEERHQNSGRAYWIWATQAFAAQQRLSVMEV